MDAWSRSKAQVVGWPDLAEVPPGVRLNLGCGKRVFPKEDGWVNVDRLPLEGVDKVVDLWEVPWPFEDNSVDYILASHIVEHVPHHIPGQAQDGFFVFFREVWRVLKPTGVVCVICPHGMTTMALQDPTHTRMVVPETFGYLAPDSGGDSFDYGLGFAFELVSPPGARVYGSPALARLNPEDRDRFIFHNWNAWHSLRVDMRPGGKVQQRGGTC